MDELKLIMKDVHSGLFCKMVDMTRYGSKYFSSVTVRYAGTNLYGDIEIEFMPCGQKERYEFINDLNELLKNEEEDLGE